MDSEVFQILVFAAVAAFVLLRLRSVLGRRTGNEHQRSDPYAAASGNRARDNVVKLGDRQKDDAESDAEPSSPLHAALSQIQAADRSFSPDQFVAGAKAAFEMIITAFSQGDLSKVKGFLGAEVYENFSDAVQQRYERRETLETTIVGISEASIIDARLERRAAYVTVKFVSEQINITRDRNNEVTDGDPNTVTTVTDLWTFARDVRSRDPNWTLIETASPN